MKIDELSVLSAALQTTKPTATAPYSPATARMASAPTALLFCSPPRPRMLR